MGIAIIIPGADFSSNNLGQITFLEDIAVTGIAISVNASYSGQTFTPTINYTPGTTNQKGVTWELTAGTDYATINATTGVVTILSGASSNTITIKATSTYDTSITATADVSVTYVETPIVPTALTITGSDTVTGQTSQYSVTYTPTNTNQLGVTWSIDSGSSYATINSSTGVVTILSGASASNVVIRVTSTADDTVYATKSLTLTYEVSQIGRKAIFAFPYDSASDTAISTTNPIDGKYWNNLGLLLSHYSAATTFVDTDGVSWFNRLYQNDHDKATTLLSSLISEYIDTTTYPNEYLGLGNTPRNNYTRVSGLASNSTYINKLFSGYNIVEETNFPKYHPFAILSVPTDATFTIRIYIATDGTDNEFNEKFGANSIVVSCPGSVPSDPLNTPIEITGVTPNSSGYILLYSLMTSYGYNKISMIEIERTA